jgi:hypothetical protein
MDNINLYRGRKRHIRLSKSPGPNMWNFTVRGAIIPDVSEITDLMTEKETATMPQSNISSLKVEDLFLGMYRSFSNFVWYVMFAAIPRATTGLELCLFIKKYHKLVMFTKVL